MGPDQNDNDKDQPSTDQFLALIREIQDSSSVEDDRMWQAMTKGAEHIAVSDSARDHALKRARLALALSRGDLTLGKYLSALRQEAHVSRDALAEASQLSSNAIARIEAGNSRILSVRPARIARLAVRLGAIKSAIMELVERAVRTPASHPGLSRLTRIERDASLLETERAVRKTQASKSSTEPGAYLSELSTAFDEELKRSRQA